MKSLIHAAGRLLLLGLLASLAQAAPARDCSQAKQLLDQAGSHARKEELTMARKAVALCEDYVTYVYLAQVLARSEDWKGAQDAFLNARHLAGGDAQLRTDVNLQLAMLTADEPGRACEAEGALQAALDERKEAHLPVPDWFLDELKRHHSAWTRQGVNAAEIQCAAQSQQRRLRAQRTDERAFCTTLSADIPLYFDTDKATLKAEGLSQVEELGKAVKGLMQSPGDRIRIEGFADETGTDAHNQMLSQQRADAVVQMLRTHLPPQTVFQAQGQGSRDPKYPGHTPELLRLNRRVEVSVVPASCHNPGEARTGS